jgi:hypothetical protein
MHINGLDVNTRAIADGLYEIICERGEEAIVAFGMIPKWIIDLTEPMVREKVIAENRRRSNGTDPGTTLDEKLLTETVRHIMHQISVDIYAVAAWAGKLLV